MVNKPTNSVVMWETDRPWMALPHFLKGEYVPLKRDSFVDNLKHCLQEATPFNKSHSAFWTWIKEEATDKQLEEVFTELKEKHSTGNGYTAAFNPALSFCTGSHNNVVLLGSLAQAKSAMFYLIPYQGKNKFPIDQSLSVLQTAMNHNNKYESTSADDRGTLQRSVKHLLERTLNQMHLKMELSDYQVTAALLGLPSMIETETFEYGSAVAIPNFRAVQRLHDQMQEENDNLYDLIASAREKMAAHGRKPIQPNAACDQDDNWSLQSFVVSDDEDSEMETAAQDADMATPVVEDGQQKPEVNWFDALGDLGYVQKVNLPSENPDDTSDPRAILVPKVALYLHRGNCLKDLNYYEYLALMKFQNKSCSDKTVKNFKDSQQFPMDPKFEGVGDCHHALRSKQATPLLVGKPPRHPGREPTDPETLEKWKTTKANPYAKHYLLIFRPETMEDNLSYSWDDLKDFVAKLQNDESFLSKARLMIMQNHMRGMPLSHRVNEMTSDFRGRNRDMWNEQEMEKYNSWLAYNQGLKNKMSLGTSMDEGKAGRDLSLESLREIRKQLAHDTQQKVLLESMNRQRNNQKELKPTSFTSQSQTRICDLSINMKAWRSLSDKKEDSTSTSHHNGMTMDDHIAESIAKLEARGAEKVTQQVGLYNLYADFFAGCGVAPPKVTLLHGGPGMGKTQVRNAIMGTSKFSGRFNLKTAFNAINACEMKGETTAYLISLKGGVQAISITGLNPDIIRDLERKGFSISSVVFIEEVSTQAPWHLAHLCKLCQDISNIHGEPFGGCHVMLIGDFTQLGPVRAGHTITQAVMDIHASREVRKWMAAQRKNASLAAKKKNKGDKTTSCPCRLVPQLSADHNRHNTNHPYRIGADIATAARWYELTQQQRAQRDHKHTEFVHGTYHGKRVAPDTIKRNYKLLSKGDIASSNKWVKAPILCCTNRERFTLTHSRAVAYARMMQCVVIRWPKQEGQWANKPPPEFVADAKEDPCFYDYYVQGCDGFVTENVYKELHIVNGLPVVFHSLKVRPEMQELLNLQMQHARPGEVITLPEAPLAVLVKIALDDNTPKPVAEALKSFSLEDEADDVDENSVIIPIIQFNCRWDASETPVYGSNDFSPSKVLLRHKLPLEPAFAITIHKSEGRTLDRVIIALSHCDVQGCNFTYDKIHVAFSRVTEGKHIRLLLTGRDEIEQWDSISYLGNLQQDPSIQFYFAGFRPRVENPCIDPNHNWERNKWCPKRANREFIRLVKENKM